MGVADIVLEWRQERITVAKQPRGGRAVRYRHYLDELAKKPQAVRQVAPEVTAELGAPYGRLWELLASRYRELDAARVLAKLIGAIVDHGEQQVGQILEDMLATPPHVPAPARSSGARKLTAALPGAIASMLSLIPGYAGAIPSLTVASETAVTMSPLPRLSVRAVHYHCSS